MGEMKYQVKPGYSNWFSPEDPQGMSQDFNRWRFSTRSHGWRPPTDLFESDNLLVVRVEVAGMREGDFSVALEDRFLLVRGFRPDIAEHRAYHQMEIPFGEFVTAVELPYPVVAEAIEAVYRDGFLRIVLPIAQPTQVKVEDNSNDSE
jgi:HSP20 family protein